MARDKRKKVWVIELRDQGCKQWRPTAGSALTQYDAMKKIRETWIQNDGCDFRTTPYYRDAADD